MLALQRYQEARVLLLGCREVFEHENSVELLGIGVVGTRRCRGQAERAGNRTAVRGDGSSIRYIRLDSARSISDQPFQPRQLPDPGRAEWRQILAHRLAAVLIGVAIGSGNAGSVLATLVRDLQQAGAAGHAALPADFAALCTTVEAVEGVRFRELMERLVGDSAQCDALLQQVVTAALETASKPEAQQ